MSRVTLALFGVVVIGCGSSPKGKKLTLPDGASGIGFDDLRYSSSLHRVLVPGGRSGRLDLIDPDTLAVTSIEGFSSKADYSGGHDDGPTSVDEASGKLYVTDRTARTLVTADPTASHVTGGIALGSEPDYVRYVAATKELWVTEPSADQIEILKLGAEGTPSPDVTIAVKNGPESLVIDNQRGRAYTHRWQGSTVVLDTQTRSVIAEWPNACSSSRGIALDEARGWLFAACSEGTVAILDVNHDGKILSTLERGSGFDVMGYNPELGHVYLAGSACACLVIAGVKPDGALSFLERHNAPRSTHCVTADDVGHAWVCDPDAGQIRRFDDRNPSTL